MNYAKAELVFKQRDCKGIGLYEGTWYELESLATDGSEFQTTNTFGIQTLRSGWMHTSKPVTAEKMGLTYSPQVDLRKPIKLVAEDGYSAIKPAAGYYEVGDDCIYLSQDKAAEHIAGMGL